MDITLATTERSADARASEVRKEGLVPCNVYGFVDNVTVNAEYMPLYKAYAKAGASAVVELDVGGKKVPAMFHEIQQDPVTDKIIHVDFLAIDMKKEMTARVPIKTEGVSYAVATLGGELAMMRDHVTVRCLPGDLPHELMIDITPLMELEDALKVSDLMVPSGVTVEEDDGLTVVTARQPRRVVEPTDNEGGEEEAEGEEGEEGAEKAEGDSSSDE